MERLHALFVCSRNQWRSPTAERVFRDDPRLSVRSCGLSPRARRRLRADDLLWADVVFVMEAKHRARLVGRFREELGETPLHVLDIPDEYPFMAPELVSLLRERVDWRLRDLLES
jgi:predicted protein tyrosine phosphatase